MILVRAPLRISFVGGGTDLPDFYRHYPGRVLSTTIDKYVYLVINPTPLIDKVTARYSISETASHPNELQHTRIKTALMDFGIERNLEIGSFASLPAKTGLGSSSSFSTALLKGLYAFQGKRIGKGELAEAACRLEIDLLKEPIGKQDQYASATGGFNIFQFNANGSVSVEPVLIDYLKRSKLEKNTLLFFTGVTRPASSVLSEQKSKISEHIETYKKMSDSVSAFKEKLLAGDIRGMASLLHDGWMLKKKFASNVSNSMIDDLYEAGLAAGAWGGKVLGAGGGGCILFLAHPEVHGAMRIAMRQAAAKNNLSDFKEIPVTFTQSGTDILFNNLHPKII